MQTGVCNYSYSECHDHSECKIKEVNHDLMPEQWGAEAQEMAKACWVNGKPVSRKAWVQRHNLGVKK